MDSKILRVYIGVPQFWAITILSSMKFCVVDGHAVMTSAHFGDEYVEHEAGVPILRFLANQYSKLKVSSSSGD